MGKLEQKKEKKDEEGKRNGAERKGEGKLGKIRG